MTLPPFLIFYTCDEAGGIVNILARRAAVTALLSASRFRMRCGKHCTVSAPRRSCVNSLWFFFAEFLEARIIPERIEHWIEPKQRGSLLPATAYATATL
jgi:hypothetical protein